MRMAPKFAVFACASIVLAGCASTDNAPEPASLPNITEYASAKVQWSQDVGKAAEFVFSPAVDGGVVYAAGRKGGIAAIDLSSGKLLRTFNAAKPISAGVAALNGKVVAASEKGDLYAFDSDGKLLWSTPTGREIVASPTITADVVVVHSSNGDVEAYGIADGKRRWATQRAIPALTLRSYAPVVASGPVVYAGLPAGKLQALSRDEGAALWEAQVSQPRGATELERVADISSAPVADASSVCAVSFQGKVGCFEAKNGNPLWTREVSSSVGLAGDKGSIYVTDDEGSVLAYDKRSGRNLWKQGRLFARQVSAPAVFGRFIAIGDYQGYVHLLSTDDGSFQARVKTDGSPILTAPIAVGDILVVQTSSGGVYAVTTR